MKTAVTEIRTYQGQEPLDAVAFLRMMTAKMALVNLDQSLLSRALHEGFSGGDKNVLKFSRWRCCNPTFAIMDETDSGLDIDAIRIVSDSVTKLHNTDHAVLLVTHYQRLLDYIIPDFVHVLYNGRIVNQVRRTGIGTGSKRLRFY